jgi:hypothetical protein
MPYPENLAHHFAVDPTKFDFYAMDCYRQLAEDKMAGHLAEEVLQASTDIDGTERAPMRDIEARITLGVMGASRRRRSSGAPRERAVAGPRHHREHGTDGPQHRAGATTGQATGRAADLIHPKPYGAGKRPRVMLEATHGWY